MPLLGLGRVYGGLGRFSIVGFVTDNADAGVWVFHFAIAASWKVLVDALWDKEAINKGTEAYFASILFLLNQLLQSI